MATPLNQVSGQPRMGAAFSGWVSKLTLQIVTQTVVNGLVVDSLKLVNFEGMIQTLRPQEIKLKPEGQWSWIWKRIHVVNGSIPLNTNDRILLSGVYYKVMGIGDRTANNFTKYDIIQDFSGTQ
jgi:hypothetical protein